MEQQLLALLLANWSGLQVCLTIKGKIEDIQYMLFGLRNDRIAPIGETRKLILGAHLIGYNVALFLVLLMTGGILIAIAAYLDIGKSKPIFIMIGSTYIIASVITGIYQTIDYQNVITILNNKKKEE